MLKTWEKGEEITKIISANILEENHITDRFMDVTGF